jgi:putative peptidoglycan lipid II flippase
MIAGGDPAKAYAVLSGAMRLMLFATFAAQICLSLAGFEATYLIWGLNATRFSVADAQATGPFSAVSASV